MIWCFVSLKRRQGILAFQQVLILLLQRAKVLLKSYWSSSCCVEREFLLKAAVITMTEFVRLNRDGISRVCRSTYLTTELAQCCSLVPLPYPSVAMRLFPWQQRYILILAHWQPPPPPPRIWSPMKHSSSPPAWKQEFLYISVFISVSQFQKGC